ncbi:MAG: hypothetical protein EOO20_05200 [Chryseobacterium sp.]|nr:MAG: hypothetical protein EOO20_05200 [Chryseobacterium sp.]
MNTATTITRQLDKNVDTKTALTQITSATLTALNAKFGSEYTVMEGNFPDLDKDWTHDIKVRKGNKIGAEVTLKWEKTNANIVTLEVDDSSKMGNQITYITLLVFLAVGAYMGYNDMEPLAFLPGRKIAAGLGGLIGLIPGVIIVSVLKSMLLKNEKEQNKQLVAEVRQAIQD